MFQNYIVVIGVQLCRDTKTALLKEVNFITIKYLKIKLFKKKEENQLCLELERTRVKKRECGTSKTFRLWSRLWSKKAEVRKEKNITPKPVSW